MSSDTTATGSPHVEEYDPEGGKMGMWLFLFTELLLFGTLLIAFAVYLHDNTWEFRRASSLLNVPIGAFNTLILLTSSLTMVLSIAALQRKQKKLSIGMLWITIACALAFIVIKAFEWKGKFDHGLYPGAEHLLELTRGENLFFGLYFTLTGLHALHVLLGVVVILFAIRRVKRDQIRHDRVLFLENVGLYWHLVDVIWIYLFPLFYLIG
jgi:cytochrome c oxidase subunit III